jgi:hypothetical protein
VIQTPVRTPSSIGFIANPSQITISDRLLVNILRPSLLAIYSPSVSIEMSKSTICKVCKGIFQGDPRKFERNAEFPHGILTENHHFDLESLQDAVQQNCFICKSSYNFFAGDIAAFASHSQEQPLLTYSLFDDEEYDWNRTKPLVPTSLEISWLHPVTGVYKPFKFHLLPRSGELHSSFVSRTVLSDCLIDPLYPEIAAYGEIANSTSSDQSIELARSWLTRCQISHGKCSQLTQQLKWYPTRLMDVGVNNDSQWRLISPRIDGIHPSKYMTLSYRWGSRPFPALKRSTMSAFFGGLPIEDLPATFRDTIMICRRFSVRYLWIDALCIQQDSEEDWTKESTKMRDVYANSTCNIAAVASMDPYGGLFRHRAPADILPVLLQASWDGCSGSDYLIWDSDYETRQVSKAELHQRGWVFQERLLTPRTVHFTDSQIFWECSIDFRCEGFPQGLPFYSPLKDFEYLMTNNQLKALDVMPYEALNCWINIIQHYSSCALTKSGDRLIALSGLAHLFEERLGESDVYFAGHWKSRLAESLDWRIEKPGRKLSNYIAPSWSWASVNTAIFMTKRSVSNIQLISDLSAKVELIGADSTGAVLDGIVTVKGCIFRGHYIPPGSPGYVETHRCYPKVPGCDDHVVINPDYSDLDLGDGSSLHYIPTIGFPAQSFGKLVGMHGMILRPVSLILQVFERVGQFSLWSSEFIGGFEIDKNGDGFWELYAQEGISRVQLTIV